MSEKICLVKTAFPFRCGRPTIRDDKCIFHLTNKTTEEAQQFEKEFCTEFEKMEKKDKELHFENFIFPKSISFSSKIFEKPLFFTGAYFSKKASFDKSKFKKEADFSRAEFSDEVDFTEAEFSDKANFWGVQFNGKKADFRYAKFDNIAHFESAKFSGVADFARAKFGNEAYFHQTQFDNKADFYSSIFIGEVRFISTKFNNESCNNFRYSKFHRPKEVRLQKVNLRNISFLGTDITEVEFLNEEWGIKDDRRTAVDESRILKDEDTTHDAVAQLYRRLRQNYEKNYRFEEAGDFFIGEMEMRRLDTIARFRNKNKILKRIELLLELSLLIIYKHLSRYGESYIRPAIIALIVIFFYPLVIHILLDFPLPDDSFLFYMRTSASSFFQMENKYVGERLLGIPILGLFFISLKRKFERKR